MRQRGKSTDPYQRIQTLIAIGALRQSILYLSFFRRPRLTGYRMSLGQNAPRTAV